MRSVIPSSLNDGEVVAFSRSEPPVSNRPRPRAVWFAAIAGLTLVAAAVLFFTGRPVPLRAIQLLPSGPGTSLASASLRVDPLLTEGWQHGTTAVPSKTNAVAAAVSSGLSAGSKGSPQKAGAHGKHEKTGSSRPKPHPKAHLQHSLVEGGSVNL